MSGNLFDIRLLTIFRTIFSIKFRFDYLYHSFLHLWSFLFNLLLLKCQTFNLNLRKVTSKYCARGLKKILNMLSATHLTICEQKEGKMKPRNQFAPLLVALVGLPGRGKSLLARRLARYLNYIGENTQVLDISEYRRKHMEKYGSHEMFKADNLPAWKLRQKSFHEALSDAEKMLNEGVSIVILDGPNVSRHQQSTVLSFLPSYRLLFLECIVDDPDLLEKSFKSILLHSADYRDMGAEQALQDLTLKMAHYRAQYESPSSNLVAMGSGGAFGNFGGDGGNVGVVKVLDAGYSGMVVSGEIGNKEMKIVGYAARGRPIHQVLYFSRHGESEYNVLGRIGGDASLSPRGRRYAQALSKHINSLNLKGLQVWTSELQRTKETTEGINAPRVHLRELNELDSGECEGLTYEELQSDHPAELARRDCDKLNYRYPNGESYKDILRRLEPVILQLETETNVLIVSHQAVLRCLLGYFLDTPLDQVPYLKVPLHTIIKLTLSGYNYTMETVKMPIECVDTNRPRPTNCSVNRSPEEALKTVPQHFDTLEACTYTDMIGLF